MVQGETQTEAESFSVVRSGLGFRTLNHKPQTPKSLDPEP